MKIVIKTLTGREFEIEFDTDKTVQDLKEQIQKNEGSEFKSDNQKLIYEGKILVNSTKLSEYKLDPKKFVVVLMTRPPPAPKKVEESKQSAPSSNKEDASKIEKQKDEASTTKTSSRTNTRTSTSLTGGASSNTVPTSAPQTTNPATNSGNSQNLQQSLQPNVAQSIAPRLVNRGPDMGAEANMATRLNHLMSLPHFANLQATLHQNPHLLSSAIESLSTVDPDMYQFVNENPDIFLNALNSTPPTGFGTHRDQMRGPTGGQRRSDASTRGQAVVSGGGMEQMSINHILPGATDHDRQAIERLKELGFSEIQAVQAYVACDKDEQLAANLLFSMDQ